MSIIGAYGVYFIVISCVAILAIELLGHRNKSNDNKKEIIDDEIP